MSWKLSISSITFSPAPNAGIPQNVEVYYRQFGSVGAFNFVDTITTDDTGAITSTPNPLTITAIPDDWEGIELWVASLCTDSAFQKVFFKPV